MQPVYYDVGQKVKITKENLKTMQLSYRSCVVIQYPKFAFDLQEGMTGEVVHTHRPGYDITVKLNNGTMYHMKDNWITPIEG